MAKVKHEPGYFITANTGAITYRPIDGYWHYCHWPNGIVCIVEWEKYKKENPNWENEIEWKFCDE